MLMVSSFHQVSRIADWGNQEPNTNVSNSIDHLHELQIRAANSIAFATMHGPTTFTPRSYYEQRLFGKSFLVFQCESAFSLLNDLNAFLICIRCDMWTQWDPYDYYWMFGLLFRHRESRLVHEPSGPKVLVSGRGPNDYYCCIGIIAPVNHAIMNHQQCRRLWACFAIQSRLMAI